MSAASGISPASQKLYRASQYYAADSVSTGMVELRLFARGATWLKSAEQLGKVSGRRHGGYSLDRGRCEPSKRGRSYFPGTVTELPLEGTGKAGSICKAKILGYHRDRLCGCRIAKHSVRFAQPFTLNIAGDTPISSNSL